MVRSKCWGFNSVVDAFHAHWVPPDSLIDRRKTTSNWKAVNTRINLPLLPIALTVIFLTTLPKHIVETNRCQKTPNSTYFTWKHDFQLLTKLRTAAQLASSFISLNDDKFKFFNFFIAMRIYLLWRNHLHWCTQKRFGNNKSKSEFRLRKRTTIKTAELFLFAK